MGVLKHPGTKYYLIRFRYKGQDFIKSSKTTNKRLAERLERQWRDDVIMRDELGLAQPITLGQAIEDEWKRNLTGKLVHVWDQYDANKDITQVTSANAHQWVADLRKRGYSNNTINHIIGIVRSACNHAKKRGHQVNDIEWPSSRYKPNKLRFLSKSEEQRLLDAMTGTPAAEEWNHIVQVLLDTGARVGEILKLKWHDIDLEKQKIYLYRPKVGNESFLFMTKRLKELFELRLKYQLHEEWVFPNESVTDCRKYDAIVFRRYVKLAGLEGVTLHTLRHTFASRLVQNGMSLYEVGQLLGHTSTETTQIYGHLVHNDVSAKAVETIENG